MTSVFTPEADTSAYEHIVPKQDLEQPNPPLKALSGRQLWAARESLKMNFHDIDDAPQEILNRVLWYDAKGWERRFRGGGNAGPSSIFCFVAEAI